MAVLTKYTLSCMTTLESRFEILVDTGATHSFTFDPNDFIMDIRPESSVSVTGFTGSEATAIGSGTVRWIIQDRNGVPITIETEAYFVPTSSRRLFCPQNHFQNREEQNHRTSQGHLTAGSTWFNFFDNDGTASPRWELVSLPLLQGSNNQNCHPTTATADYCTECSPTSCYNCSSADERLAVHPTVLSDSNENLSGPKKELLLWHDRLGHCGFGRVQRLMRSRTVDEGNGNRHIPACIPTCYERTRKFEHPICASCMYGKQQRRPDGGDLTTNIPAQQMALQRGHLHPGDCISLDHYESSVRGRLPNTFGREPWYDRYVVGTIFVDHASGYVHTYHQSTLTAGATIRSKRRFEAEAGLSNVTVKGYHGDNEVIKTIFFRARSMMLHASIRWPDQVNGAVCGRLCYLSLEPYQRDREWYGPVRALRGREEQLCFALPCSCLGLSSLRP
jgi:hypothetical protein